MTEGVTVLVFSSPQALLCLKKGVHPTAWSAEQRANSLPRLCSTQQASHGLPRQLLRTMGQAGDMESCWMARPVCKKASRLCGKEHYGCIHTVLFQMSPSAVLHVLRFRSGLTPFYALITPTVGIVRPFCVAALVLLRKGGASLSQAFE